jgi:hypothetical protein
MSKYRYSDKLAVLGLKRWLSLTFWAFPDKILDSGNDAQ